MIRATWEVVSGKDFSAMELEEYVESLEEEKRKKKQTYTEMREEEAMKKSEEKELEEEEELKEDPPNAGQIAEYLWDYFTLREEVKRALMEDEKIRTDERAEDAMDALREPPKIYNTWPISKARRYREALEIRKEKGIGMRAALNEAYGGEKPVV